MDFIDSWRDEIRTTIVESAKLAATINGVELEYALMATGMLWPLRQPVQDFEMEAIEAVNKIVGQEAKHILRVVQGWDDDLMEAAQDLRFQISKNADLENALNVLIKQFRVFFIFAEELANQPKADTPLETASGTAEAALSSFEAGLAAEERGQAMLSIVSEKSPVRPPRVFVSYARSDGEALARDMRQRLEREEIPVWQDRIHMEGGRDWWLQITEALNEVEFMVLVMTPAAMRSEIVQKEWRYARQQGVCVYPLKGDANLDFSDLPRWMRNVHFYDPEIEWSKLVKDLNSPCETPRVPFMVEELPEDFVARSGQLDQLVSFLLDDSGDPIATTVALQGTGGYGKTMLAKALCHNEDIRQAFDDGILWVSFGENPGDLTGRVVDLVEVLSGERPGFAGLEAAETRLFQLLADRDILMVLDDVWNVAHLKPFTRGGGRCARLITTRNVAAIPPKTQNIEVAAMDQNEAVSLLSMSLPAGSFPSFRDLADRLGQWPLLLKLTNSTLRDRVYNNNQPLTAALAYVNKALDKRGLTAFDAHNAAARDQAVSQTLGVSQELLEDNERQRYGELAIFPGEVNVPLSVLEKLWQTTGGLDDFDTEELCNRFDKLSLLAHFDPTERYFKLHKIVRNYLAQEQGEKLVVLHDQLLNAYSANLPATGTSSPLWSQLAHQESYLWTYLAYHLVGAERGAELVETAKDLSYLVNKTYLRGAFAAEADMLAARQVVPGDAILTRLHQSISQSNHLLNQATVVGEIANTLHSRISHITLLAELVAAGERDLAKPLFTAYHRLPDLPDASLIRTLTGHGAAVLACDISADGSTVVSMSRDTNLKVWDAHTGAESFTLTGHQVIGNSCRISADGSVVVSATWDGVLKIWNARTGTERFSIKAHSASLFGCAISGDGSTIITASKDKTIKVWDAHTGTERFTLEGHERSVTGCDISADGSLIVSSSPDGTVRLWDGFTGMQRSTLRAYEVTETHNQAANLTFTAATSALLTCVISADGSTAVTVLPDGVLKVWDTATATERFVLKGHSGWVENCAISADGSLIISASNDKTIRGWDAQSGTEKFKLEGHMRTVTGCALSADGTIIASSSQDKTLKLWDSESGADQSTSSGYISAVQTCAVSAEGQTIIVDSTGNTLKVIDAITIAERLTLKGHMRPVTGCVISADGTTIVSSSQDRTLKIWDASRGTERITLRGHMWAVNDCALSSDNNTIVSVSEDSTLKVWDASTGAERFTLTGHMRAINGCTISPDGAFIVSAGADKLLKVWEASTGAARFTLSGHEGPVNSCAVSPDNLLIASTSNDDTVKLWNSRSGQEQHTLKGHTSSVLRAVFSPNGQFILTVSKDKTVKLWSVQSGQCLTTLRVDGPLSSCAWFPNGQHIVAVGSRGAYFLRLMQ